MFLPCSFRRINNFAAHAGRVVLNGEVRWTFDGADDCGRSASFHRAEQSYHFRRVEISTCVKHSYLRPQQCPDLVNMALG